jgi:hypothetical protein
MRREVFLKLHSAQARRKPQMIKPAYAALETRTT